MTATETKLGPPTPPDGLQLWYVIASTGRKRRYPATEAGVAAAADQFRGANPHPANEVRAIATSSDPAVVERYRDRAGWCDLHARTPYVHVASTLDVERGEWGEWIG